MFRCLLLAVVLSAPLLQNAHAAEDKLFDDPMFRRCVTWMLTGQRGALIDNICLDDYQIPSPAIFRCAQKVQTGFLSETDREVCAIIFEEQVKKTRAGFIK